ncbi:MAG TPA: methylamine utilization protein, partial [Planctomycetaceae bacterium]|nr:methylamine utilization protein [Planctomycetaceae bacterium]
MRRFFCVLLAVALLAAAPLAHGAGWGNVKGKFLYDGTPPTPGALSITKDKEYCGKFSLVDERLVVNPDNKGIANVVVMLYVRRGKKVNVHPDLKKASGSVELDNNHCRFDPHIAFVRTGQELVIKNSDTI